MEVQDCGVDGEGNTELAYKFGLLVQNDDNVVPDIGKGSTGQRDIVDLAFRIEAMNYLKISENQLVLVEIASNMDPGHREASVELIKQLLYQLPFSQMIVVSHDYQQYGALTQAQICVLCARNVVAPAEYNQHVKMQ
jgi:ABC-type Mn2+/Zn2+ transport system ATPase subunit